MFLRPLHILERAAGTKQAALAPTNTYHGFCQRKGPPKRFRSHLTKCKAIFKANIGEISCLSGSGRVCMRVRRIHRVGVVRRQTCTDGYILRHRNVSGLLLGTNSNPARSFSTARHATILKPQIFFFQTASQVFVPKTIYKGKGVHEPRLAMRSAQKLAFCAPYTS